MCEAGETDRLSVLCNENRGGISPKQVDLEVFWLLLRFIELRQKGLGHWGRLLKFLIPSLEDNELLNLQAGNHLQTLSSARRNY